MFARTAVSALFLGVVGCGGGGGSAVDAGDIDALVIIDAAFTDIRVRAFDNGTPLENVTVVSHDAAGMPVATAVTDTNGEVIVDSTAVSIITVLSVTGQLEIQSFADVSPGDTITVGRPEPAVVLPEPALQTLNVTSSVAPNGATDNYIVSNGCNSIASPIGFLSTTLETSERCAISGAVDALIVAEVGGIPVEYAIANDVAVAAAPGNADLTGWSDQFTNIDISFTEIPLANGLSILVSSGLHNNRGSFVFGGTGGTPAVTDGATSFSTKIPAGIGQYFRFGMTIVHLIPGPLNGTQSYTRRDDSPGASYIINANDLIPGRVSALNLDATIPSEPSLSFSTIPSAAPIDAAVCRVNWSDSGMVRNWTMTRSPSETGRCTYPTLPENLLEQAPDEQSLFASATISFFDDSTLAGYSSVLSVGELDSFARDQSIANSRGTITLDIPTP